MAIYRIADLNVRLEHRYPFTERLCKDYLAPDDAAVDIIARPNPEEYAADRAVVPQASDGYLEALSLYRDLSHQLLDYDGFILHASVVERQGKAYAFTAKSGTGKTTHCRLWLERFPDARIINGDKPLVRLNGDDGKVYVYGTPWCGKENYNVNTKAPLAALCFVERAAENSIEPLAKADAVGRLFSQLLLPKDAERMNKLLTLLDTFAKHTPMYRLRCNMDPEAAEVAYRGMSGGSQI